MDILRSPRALLGVLLVAALAVAAAGCGSAPRTSPVSDSSHSRLLRVSLTDEGCSPKKLTARSGSLTFVVTNGGTKRVSELEVLKPNGVVLGEKEHVVGKLGGSFTLRLGPGHYVLACPLPGGGGNGKLVVTGKPLSLGAGGG
jgi:iron uptake system component EfeO